MLLGLFAFRCKGVARFPNLLGSLERANVYYWSTDDVRKHYSQSLVHWWCLERASRAGLSYQFIHGVRASLYYWSSDLMVLEELISISGPLIVLERAGLYYLPVRALGKGCLCQWSCGGV